MKKSTSELKEAIVSIVAILNKHGKGELYFGVKNDETVVGQDVTEKTLRDISQAIANNIEDKIYPKIEEVVLEGKKCVRVEFMGDDAPYYAYGRPYIRVGDEDRKLGAKETKRLILAKSKEELRWDNMVSKHRASDVSVKTLKVYLARGKKAGRISFSFKDTKSTLRKLGLLSGSSLTNAGEVLFCKQNRIEVQAAVFAGEDKLTFLDIKEFYGTIFDLLNKCEEYIKEHIDWRVKFGKLRREEIPEIPVEAVREALVNSLCHRDYTKPESNKVAVYKNRVEIYNPGQFPEGFTPRDFIDGEVESILRNPLIAETYTSRRR